MVAETFIPKWFNIAVRKSSLFMNIRNNPWATVIDIHVDKGNPTSKVLLRFNKTIAIVLMPRETARFFHLFINYLVPIQPDIGADKVVSYFSERRPRYKIFGFLKVKGWVNSE